MKAASFAGSLMPGAASTPEATSRRLEMYVLHGFDPSPYSVKMRAILRYRRIPFIWRAAGNPRDVAVAGGLPPVIPVLQFPDGRLMNFGQFDAVGAVAE